MADAQLVSDIRAASRDLVRGLGFMQRHIAGTDLSPSAVHAIIEIGREAETSATDISARLRLEKSTVSRLLAGLAARGLLEAKAAPGDSRMRHLSLTPAGRQTLAAIDAFADGVVETALQRMDTAAGPAVLAGLDTYARALADPDAPARAVVFGEGYRQGLPARMLEMIGGHMAGAYGFGRAFEVRVGGDIADFFARLGSARTGTWWATLGGRVVGTISMDGEDLGDGIAHLRWFVVDPAVRGRGVGAALLAKALAFADAGEYRETHLWTVKGLEAARTLYDRTGFVLAEEYEGDQWGTLVTEHKLVRLRPD